MTSSLNALIDNLEHEISNSLFSCASHPHLLSNSIFVQPTTWNLMQSVCDQLKRLHQRNNLKIHKHGQEKKFCAVNTGQTTYRDTCPLQDRSRSSIRCSKSSCPWSVQSKGIYGTNIPQIMIENLHLKNFTSWSERKWCCTCVAVLS